MNAPSPCPQKTDKGRAELQPGGRTLGLRERSLLLMADGRRTAADMASVFGEDTPAVLQRLIDGGFLALPAPVAAPRASAVPVRQEPARAQPATNSGRGADTFDGKRSLATTRMFLFDVCERMFARRDPVLAERIREALRQARDRESMLSESRFLIEEIEKVAGFERADSISERIAMLLPPEGAVAA